MPRYYFNLCSPDCETTDTAGESCADDVEALNLAFRAASEILHTRLFRNQPVEDAWIEVEDEDHREVLRLPLRAAAY